MLFVCWRFVVWEQLPIGIPRVTSLWTCILITFPDFQVARKYWIKTHNQIYVTRKQIQLTR